MAPISTRLVFKMMIWIFIVSGILAGNVTHILATQKPTTDDAKLQKIMILFLGHNYEKRKTVESEITYYINDSGFEALQSYKYFTQTDLPETETIIKALEDNGFDGLLVIEIMDVELKKERVNAKMNYGYGPGTPFMYDYFSIYRRYSEGYERIDTFFELGTSLFRLEDKSLIYSDTSEAYDKGDIDMALEGFAKEVARKLKKSKTLLKTK